MNEQTSDRVDPILSYLHALDPGRDLSAKAVAMRLRRAAHYVDTQVRRHLAPCGIDLWELDILSTMLRENGTVGVGQLQDAAQLTAGAITNRITRLEKDGYVARAIDIQDRRQIVVTLTELGRQHAVDVIKANDEAQRATLDQIDPEILRRLADDLRTFLVAVEGPRRAASGPQDSPIPTPTGPPPGSGRPFEEDKS